jgi:hypothetical protein
MTKQQGQMTEREAELEAERELVQLAVRALDSSLLDIDAATLSRLNQARHQALESRSRTPLWRAWMPAAATGSVALALAIALPLNMQQVAQQPIDDSLIMPALSGDVSLAALEDAELLEDLDMMLWLIEEENHAS